MAFENLDAQDKAICDAMVAGTPDAQIMEEFDVTEEKLGQLRSVVAEAGEVAPEPEAPADANTGVANAPEPTPEEEVAGETVAEANDEEVPADTAGEVAGDIL